MKVTKENAGKTLLDHRLKNKLTQADIAEKTDISLPTISGIESGKIKPQTMTIHKLQIYFDSNGI